MLFLPLLTACGGDNAEQAKSIADYKNATTADSLVFYFGQMRAAEYWREAHADTTLASRESRDEFLKGLRAGMDAVRSNMAYNQGVYLGIQLAMNLNEMDEGYGIKTKKDIMLEAFADGLRNDSVVDYTAAAEEFSTIINALNTQKEEKDRQLGKDALVAEAKALKMTKINDDLYAAAPKTPGTGNLLQVGDSVAVVLIVTQVGGEEIDRQAKPDFKIGSSLIGPITEALLTMRIGENREFLTTPPALMGRVYARRGLKPNDLLKIEIFTSPAKPRTDNAASGNASAAGNRQINPVSVVTQ